MPDVKRIVREERSAVSLNATSAPQACENIFRFVALQPSVSSVPLMLNECQVGHSRRVSCSRKRLRCTLSALSRNSPSGNPGRGSAEARSRTDDIWPASPQSLLLKPSSGRGLKSAVTDHGGLRRYSRLRATNLADVVSLAGV